MNKGAVVLVAVLGLSNTGLAVQRKHHPWFAHPKPAVSPSSTGRPVAAGETKAGGAGNDGRGSQVVTQALQYRGTRYQFGGTTKRGLDCSGLVSRVWSDLKLKKIPRVSSALYKSGLPVHSADLRPGDLVFFKNTYKRGISHVGVYAGNNKFVHASGKSKGVTIAKLSDPYYQLHYAGARRLY